MTILQFHRIWNVTWKKLRFRGSDSVSVDMRNRPTCSSQQQAIANVLNQVREYSYVTNISVYRYENIE